MFVSLLVDSSAISEVSFDYDTNEVGVVYHSNPDTAYVFGCNDLENVESQVRGAQSVGKLIAQLKKNEVLVPLEV
jgi:hypothetical protein